MNGIWQKNVMRFENVQTVSPYELLLLDIEV